MEITLIAAVAANGVIGDGTEIPWSYPADLAHFKRVTTGHPVIMGRVTFEGILETLGEPLPDRTNIVLTSGTLGEVEGAVAVDGIDAAVSTAEETGADEAFVIGGASVYEQFLQSASRLIITEIPEAVEGDTYWPGHDEDDWRQSGTEALSDDLVVRTYTRVGAPAAPGDGA